jgi:hypothetical protein
MTMVAVKKRKPRKAIVAKQEVTASQVLYAIKIKQKVEH